MKQSIIILLLLSALSCEKENNNLKEVNVTSMETELECFRCTIGACYDCEFVITNKNSYLSLDSLKSDSEECTSVQLPEIEFNEKTLLGKCTSIAGCAEVTYYRKVEKNKSTEKYIYTIEIDTSGRAHCYDRNMNWICVPKIPSNYSIEFKVIYK